MSLSEELRWRGQIKDTTFTDLTWLDQPQTFYYGADVGSADSLTVGNLAGYMVARRLLAAGWKAVMLVGGATSLIGDPGGKTEERDLASRKQVEHNKTAIVEQVRRIFMHKDFTLVDNYDWFKDTGYLEFLRDVGKHYSMTELLQRDYIADRIGEGKAGISYAEFSYSLIQGYDFWYLFKNHGVVLQIGGSDQWGNMLSGVPLIRKKEAKIVHAMSFPLVINKATGIKFGKSEEGAVWLDANKTSVYKFYQFWLNVEDEAVEDYLKIYTELDKPSIDELMTKFSKNRADRLAQKTLAYEVTKLVHGEERADSVCRISQVLFGGGDYKQLTTADFDLMQAELPTYTTKPGEDVIDCLIATGLASSKTEARRFLNQGAVYINGQAINESRTLKPTDSIAGHAILRRGKNSNALLRIP